MYKTDFLVIGSGIAALTFALKVADNFSDLKVTIITKDDKLESNTKYAQGGIATVLNEVKNDSFAQHFKDTILAGDGLCNEEVVKMVVEEAPIRLEELLEWGVNFDKSSNGEFSLGKEGGHSQNRILHHKDITGFEIIRALLKKVSLKSNIEVFEHHFALELITQHHVGQQVDRDSNISCYGAYVLDTKFNKVKRITSKITMLATGGIGQVYKTTTNPKIATGDGIAMAYRAKAEIENMEFIQFHPTGLYDKLSLESSCFLISEAVRGFGAYLRNIHGERFMNKYDSRMELASRDIVARAIDNELKVRGDEYVFLDCTHLDFQKFKEKFPNILEKCISIGLDIKKDMIPVAPVAHYLCGGIKVNVNGKTSIENLFASGECASTGLHGANRLASNSLLEAIVYSHKSFMYLKATFDSLKSIPESIPTWNDKYQKPYAENILITHERMDLNNIMNDYIGIIRSNKRLLRANNRLEILYNETLKMYEESKVSRDLCELRNLITIGYLITQFSISRKENKGGFFNVDLIEKKIV